jgi:hypothetical protein
MCLINDYTHLRVTGLKWGHGEVAGQGVGPVEGRHLACFDSDAICNLQQHMLCKKSKIVLKLP